MRWLMMTVALVACTAEPIGVGTDTDGGKPDLAMPDLSKPDQMVGVCCPPDPRPGCCMRYGGWSLDGSCPTLCDGMPWPDYPGWQLVTDDHGCKKWFNPSEGACMRCVNACGCGCRPLFDLATRPD